MEQFKPFHLLVGTIHSNEKAPIGTVELTRADAVRKIIITACMELKQGEAAVVGTRGKVSHDWFAVLGVEGGWTVHHSKENYMTMPVTGIRFRYSIAPEFFEGASACGDRVILSG